MATVTVLAAMRQRLWDDFNSRHLDDEKIDNPQYKKIQAIEAKLLKATFKTRADHVAGRAILAGGDDPAPIDWCYFKSDLYLRMVQFA